MAAKADFIEGISFSLATAIVFLALSSSPPASFSRGKGAIAGAEREPIASSRRRRAREAFFRRSYTAGR